MQQNVERIAETFVQARRAGTAVLDFPGTIPDALAEAYAVQDHALALDGRRVSGWKVGKIHPPTEGENRLAGPIFADQIVVATEAPVAMPVFARGFAAAEAEFLLRIGTAPDPAKRTYSMEEAIDLRDAVHVGIEIASSPFPGINDHGATVTISDFGNNNGLVIGPAIENWRTAGIADWPVELTIDGAPIGAATAASMLDGPFGAARFLFELLAARGIALQPGDWISSGAVTGVHQVSVGARVDVRFDNRLTAACTIVAW
ncbi:2-keto-4-pentenoate hydratase [Sphingomonas sp. PL-96]|uniref:2-keto-4-pentenoate hydratase n=1 Tax=Sphingomonas sp. PL-96 TaxID=2887201 RepID=UPI001E3A31B5|nr:2-keto-4-pentenoate hydratase [Sphingomonas sp. PL-96]